MNSIMRKVLAVLAPQLLGLLPQDIVKTAIDKALDVIEDMVAASKTKIDDATILPLCRMIRNSLDIPDNDRPGAG